MKFRQNIDVAARLTLRVKAIGQRSRSPADVKKHYFRCHLSILQVSIKVKVKGFMGQGRRLTLKDKDQGQQVKNVISGLI